MPSTQHLLARPDSPDVTLSPSSLPQRYSLQPRQTHAPCSTSRSLHVLVLTPQTPLPFPTQLQPAFRADSLPLPVAFLAYPVRTYPLPHLFQPQRCLIKTLCFSDPCKHKHVGLGQSWDPLLPCKAGWERLCKVQILNLLGCRASSSTIAQLSLPGHGSSHLVVVKINRE